MHHSKHNGYIVPCFKKYNRNIKFTASNAGLPEVNPAFELEQRLKLYVNLKKSRICTSNELEFLGFCFRGNKIVCSDKALHRFKHRIKQLTERSWGVSLAYRYRELRRYIVGWMNYFALSEYYRPIPEPDEWLRRRMRCCYLRQWRWTRTKISHLVCLGVSLKEAIKSGVSSKGPYAMPRTPNTQMAMNNEWLKEQGLVSIKDQWVRFHYPVSFCTGVIISEWVAVL